jgi:hypothetical protein
VIAAILEVFPHIQPHPSDNVRLPVEVLVLSIDIYILHSELRAMQIY